MYHFAFATRASRDVVVGGRDSCVTGLTVIAGRGERCGSPLPTSLTHAAHDAGADGAAAFTHREAHADFERDVVAELEVDFGAVARTEQRLREQ